MNATPHAFAPEEIMAFLDGELPASEAQAVSAHLATCLECSAVANQFRATSQWLAHWEVEPAPIRLDAAIEKSTANYARTDKPVPSRAQLWNWKLWGSGSLAAAAMVVIALAFFNFTTKKSYTRAEIESLTAPNGGTARYYSGGGFNELPAPPPPPAQMERAPSGSGGVLGGIPPSARFEAATVAPMIARTVSMGVVVKDFTNSRAALDAILIRHRGYSAQLHVTTPENGPRSLNASLRIPAPELAAALAELKSLGSVENETQSGEEVTQQHADLLARLHNARETEDRFRAILAQRTGKVSDVLEVEESIARVRGEIEQMEAEQQTLEHRVDFATVNIELTEQYKASLDSPSDPVGTRLHNAFVAGYRNASDTILGIAVFFAEYGPSLLIWLLILGTPAWFLWHRYRSRRR